MQAKPSENKAERTDEEKEPAGDPDIDSDLPKASTESATPPPLPTAQFAGNEIRRWVVQQIKAALHTRQ